MATRIGINGFGRIGKNVLKAILMYQDRYGDIELVAINDLTDSKTLAHLFKYDSVSGPYGGEVTHTPDSIVIDGKTIRTFAERDPKQIPWKAEKVDIVLCDHVGYFGFDYDILKLLADARERFLKPNGIVVPGKIDVMLAPIESNQSRDLVTRWSDGSVPAEFDWVANAAANTKLAVDLKADELIADPASLGTLNI